MLRLLPTLIVLLHGQLDGGTDPGAEDVAPMQTVVTGTRAPRPLRDVPGTVTVLPRAEIERNPTLTLDSLIRAVPSAATFRRTTSLVSDPSAQGLNLRGVGPSGVSRGLVWVDGVPANDPFGGWIYWQSIPRLGLERIEIAPGGGSALYGSSALGGVMQLFSRPVATRTVEGELVGGSHDTALLALRAAHPVGPVFASLEGELLTTAGYPIVEQARRGAIDARASSRHATLTGAVGLEPGGPVEATLRFGGFAEGQNGGTRFTTAAVSSLHASVDATWRGGSGQSTEVVAFGKLVRFDQERARVSADRSIEALSASQRVPANEQGLSLTFRSPPLPLGGTHAISLGGDLRRVAGHAEEDLFPPGPTAESIVFRDAGGEQLFAGLFLQDQYAPGAGLQWVGAVRLDGWLNQQGYRSVERQSGATDRVDFSSRSEVQVSPRLGVLYRPWDPLAFRASAYRAFRAPTLNELYRPFQVGTVLTAANEALVAETLLGAEAGVEALPAPGVVLRATGFLNELRNPVTNVTLDTPLPDGSQRQRQNLGRARIPGVEFAADIRFTRRFTILLAYTFADARVTEAHRPDLVGKLLAQDPQHRGTAALGFVDPRLFSATIQARVNGPQFEDDLNTLEMGGYLLLDASVTVPISGGLELFAAVENLLDRRYLVGRAGVDTVGQPRMIRGGIRLREPR